MQITYHLKKPIKNKHKRYHYYKKDGKWKPKIKFDSQESAEKYLKQRHKTEEYNIYVCPYCGKYHIGHLDEKYNKEND